MERHPVRPARFKRPAVRRARRHRSLSAFAAALLAMVAVPTLALGAADDLVNGVLGATGGAGERAGTPPNYQPPLHGTNPHGQGTVATVDLNPSNSAPLPGDPAQSDEDVVVGDSRGEQNGGTYHGRVTVLHVNLLGLINQDIGRVETSPGQTNNGPLGPIQSAIDANICTPLGQAAGCVTVAGISSSTTNTGSSNSFQLASANLAAALPVVGALSVSAGAAGSQGNISENSNCQTATGSSNVANADVDAAAITALDPVEADVLSSSSTSQACNDGSKSTTNDSNVLSLMGQGIPVPAAGCPGPNETPDTNFTALAPVIATVCNADDVDNGQTGAPYGVREALSVFGLGGVIKVAFSGPESHAVAPDEAGGPGEGEPAGEVGGPDDDGRDTSTAGELGEGGDSLPFTGANLLLLGLVGVGLIALGLAGTTLSRYRRTAEQL
jgi:hypothetical protein